MEDLHQWMLTTFGGKEATTKAKEKHYKGSKGKGKYRSKGHYKGFDKGNKGS